MTFIAAKKFIRQAQNDNELRSMLNTANDNSEREKILKDHDLLFNYEEFDDAYNSMLASCQSENDTDDLKNFKLWWDFITTTP